MIMDGSVDGRVDRSVNACVNGRGNGCGMGRWMDVLPMLIPLFPLFFLAATEQKTHTTNKVSKWDFGTAYMQQHFEGLP